ncbi:unnamed protein product [Darwinula stevensoni]|uniref:Uncharacterized protein n=1 Tax=Darwinula stevensoni TaxID=69355 RepID=A0A7R9A900_9CRUS|nr:unnamed protein product [Darwinula stevensoni]CAG0896931.1 unnamed protein product [Darwinula stevensoni]
MAETKEVQNSSDETNMPVDIFEMVKKQDVEAVRSCLATMKNVKELYDSDGMSLLQHAAYRGNKDMCRMLLDHGADVNETKHIHNYTCLHFAALSGNRDVVQMMLEAGADPDATNSINRTPGQMAAFVGHHAVVASINNFIPKSMVEYYTKPQGLEKDPKIPPIAAPALHSYLIQVRLNDLNLKSRSIVNIQSPPPAGYTSSCVLGASRILSISSHHPLA